MPALPKRNPARRNRSTTSATLTADARVKAPPLPKGHDWHPATVAWWRDVWASPMAPEYHESDVHGLYILAMLVDGFWTSPSQALAAEIRLQRQCFGLTPIDRRRLQWEIERTDEAQEKGRRRRTSPSDSTPAEPAADPRLGLYVVQ
jgi:tRNA U34 5-methylaminomethyl-2-thiouridine-forming methyltransferase MnmC